MHAFFVPLVNDEPKQDWSRSVASETELGSKRNCADCGHEWEAE